MSKRKQNPSAAVVIIGNEILSGRTQDTNLSFLGNRCDELGVNLKEARVIPDDERVIIETVNHCREQFDYVFTTGGIGPTHDDITSMSIARAFGIDVERNAGAVAAMERYYPPGKLNEARLRMADMPVGAILIDNPVSGAPGFQIENVFVLPGVPLIMQAMFDGITDRLVGGSPVLTDNIKTDLRESIIADGLAVIQEHFPGVSIGSYPFFKAGMPGVNLVLRSTDATALHAAVKDVRILVESLDGRVFDGRRQD